VSNSDHHVARPERLLPLPQRCCCRGVSGAIGSAPGCGQGQSPGREADEGGHHGSSRSDAEQPARSQTPVRDACDGICELCAPSQLRIAPHLTLASTPLNLSPHTEKRHVCMCVLCVSACVLTVTRRTNTPKTKKNTVDTPCRQRAYRHTAWPRLAPCHVLCLSAKVAPSSTHGQQCANVRLK
jgi:hypothetical protein